MVKKLSSREIWSEKGIEMASKSINDEMKYCTGEQLRFMLESKGLPKPEKPQYWAYLVLQLLELGIITKSNATMNLLVPSTTPSSKGRRRQVYQVPF